jgi:hypothetical protein
MSRDISLVGWEWGVYVSTLGFFDDESNYLWVGVALRRYAAESHHVLATFRSVASWLKVIEWQLRSDESMPQHLDFYMSTYLRAGNSKSCSDNPWSISHGTEPRRTKSLRPGCAGVPFKVDTYSIGRVRTLVEDIAWLRRNAAAAQAAQDLEWAKFPSLRPEDEGML